tara:strand:+ start:12612 stop:13238 length:627 start_codon:yes stop_codon:yes gene_type:complete
MSDPGYGSYILSAAEAERNRRTGNAQLMKKLDMQKYGIDTQSETTRYGIDKSAETAANALALEQKKFEAQQAEYNRRLNNSMEVAGTYISNEAEKQRSGNVIEDLKQDELEADQYSGFLYNTKGGGLFPNLKEAWRGDEAYDEKYGITVDGVSVNPQLKDLNLTDNKITVEELMGPLGYAAQATDAQSGKTSTESHLDTIWNYFGKWR